MKCECKVGPGKYEGEGPETFLLHHDADDDYVSYGDGSWEAVAVLPVQVSDEAVQAALDYGYCAECIDAARKELAATKGAYTYGEDSQGFAWSVYWENGRRRKSKQVF
jgi:hypothetical protein